MARRTGQTDATGATLTSAAPTAGTSAITAKADHTHQVGLTGPPVDAGGTAATGSGTSPAPYDHVHGLTGATLSQSTASPNGTVYASRMLAKSSTTNADLVMQPKGTGSFLAQLPDSTATGGNKRGLNAVDLQMSRASTGATAVASGDYSIILGGQDNTASGANSAVVGGGGGSTGTASAQNAWAAGGTASGSYSRSFLGTASGSFSTAIGNSALASRYGKVAISSGVFATEGDAQKGLMVLRAATSNATAKVLTADAQANSASNSVTLPNATAYAFDIRLNLNSATVGTGATVYGTLAGNWIIQGLIRRGAGAGTTAIVGTPLVTPQNIDTAISAVSVAVTADTTLGALAITVTGLATTNMRWVAVVTTTEG